MNKEYGRPVPVRLRPVATGPVTLAPRPTGVSVRNARHGDPPPPGLRQVNRPPRKERRGGWWKSALVVLFATGLTTLAIRASDQFSIDTVFRGDQLVAGTGASVTASGCPSDMIFVPASGGGFCIDTYEASPGIGCARADVNNEFDTMTNIGDPKCLPASAAHKRPWTYVAQPQALELCARVGKRLPTNAEWYRAAMGTPDDLGGEDGCVLGRTGAPFSEATGGHSRCRSSFGAFDMVGNVWEWVDAYAAGGWYENRELPGEGFVAETDASGVPSATVATSSAVFRSDYFFIQKDGVRAMFRGGYWNMDERAGVNTINATMPNSFVGTAVGFRCAK